MRRATRYQVARRARSVKAPVAGAGLQLRLEGQGARPLFDET
jgi:hypothetical protein